MRNEKWMPFLRGGYADDGGTLLQKSFSAGLAYHWGANNSLFGLGFNWNQPNEDTFAPGLKNQTSVELFSRCLWLFGPEYYGKPSPVCRNG